MSSLAFRLSSSSNLSKTQRSAHRQIAFRLPEISLHFSTVVTIEDSAQQALDQLAILQSEKWVNANSYLETEAERKRAMAKEEMTRRCIVDIETELSLLQEELEYLCPRREEAARRLTKTIQEQNRLYLLSIPLDRRIKDLESHKSFFTYSSEKSQDDIQQATTSWNHLRLLLEGPPPNHAEDLPMTAVQPSSTENLLHGEAHTVVSTVSDDAGWISLLGLCKALAKLSLMTHLLLPPNLQACLPGAEGRI